MANKIVLVSDDKDFFDYIRAKLLMRKSDELFNFNFDDIPEKLYLLDSAVIIINSEGAREKTVDLLNIIKGIPSLVFAYNDDEIFKKNCYKAGTFDFITMLTSEDEIQSRMLPALTISALLKKNQLFKNILIKKEILTEQNEIFLNYSDIIEDQLHSIKNDSIKAVFGAISPADNAKFFLNSNIIETILINNIRKNDLLMNFAHGKYFILMFDIDKMTASKVWEKISSNFPNKIYAGFVTITNQSKEELINKALDELHFEINKDKNIPIITTNPIQSLSNAQNTNSTYTNFKLYKQEFDKKIEQIISPVFYQIQQKYNNKLMGVSIKQGKKENAWEFQISTNYSKNNFKITTPGFSKINIDITYQKDINNIDTKRISIEPEELESGFLFDLLEQFILEYKNNNK